MRENELFQKDGEYSTPDTISAYFDLEMPPGIPLVFNDITRLKRNTVSETSIDQAVAVLIGTTFKTETALYGSSQAYTEPMSTVVGKLLGQLSPETTAILLPGEGAKAVERETLSPNGLLEEFKKFYIPTDRKVENGKVVGVTVAMPAELTSDLQKGIYTSVAVIEDVVATGTTLNTIAASCRQCAPSPLTLHAATWFCRRPTQVFGYQSISGICRYWTREGYPALNTLSTWLRTDAKGAVVREQYKKKYIRYPYGFDKQIEYIRSLTTIGDLYE